MKRNFHTLGLLLFGVPLWGSPGGSTSLHFVHSTEHAFGFQVW